MIILAFWISLTRISDYFHHPMDVVTCAIVGIGFAGMALLVIADVFIRKSSFSKKIMSEDSEPSQSNIIYE
jgi:membrane-associated phospholipid phosphatase